MNIENVSDLIIENVGGVENISDLNHCATRLRFRLKDESLFNKEKIQGIPGILGAVKSGVEHQVIVGAEVGKIYGYLYKNYLQNLNNPGVTPKTTNKNFLMNIIDTIVTIMAPVMTPFIGAGMFKVIVSLMVTFGLDKEGMNYQLLNAIGDGVFYFVPLIIAVSAAKRFNTNQYLAVGIIGILMHPSFTGLVAAGDPISLFGIPIRGAAYNGTVIPVILIVLFMSYVERFADKVTPAVIRTMMKPLLIILITAPVALVILGPLGAILGDGLFYVISFLSEHVPWLVPTLMGIFTPLLVMVGMHVSLFPLASLSLSTVGSEMIMGPGMLASNLAQAGASFAVFLKTKDKELKQVALSAGITGLTGISEPALYGITLKLKRPLIYVMIAGGVGGFYAGITNVVRYSFGSPGILTLPVFIGEDPKNLINAVITLVIGFVVAFVLTLAFGWDTSQDSVSEEKEILMGTEPAILTSVVDGKVMPLNLVKDEVFSTGMMGAGVAVQPNSNIFVSPISGTVTSVFPSGHAIGLTGENGLEILIHIGLDTVQLEGCGFQSFVKEGDKVIEGQKLVEANIEEIKRNGFDPVTMILVLNHHDFTITNTEKEDIHLGEELLMVGS